MVSRFLLRLRAFLPAIALVAFIGNFAAPVARARTPYDYTDRTEGDPGDGVLDPATDRDTASGYAGSGNTPTVGASLAENQVVLLADYFAVPLYLPGSGTVVFVKSDWIGLTRILFLGEGRGPHAP